MEKANKGTFEQAFNEMNKMAEMMKDQDITLEDAMKCYENGMKYYKICNEILENAKQKIEVFEGEV